MNRSVLLVINVDWFFISHRLQIGLELLRRGYDVHVLCGDTGRFEELESMGFFMLRLPISRSGLGVLRELSTLVTIFRAVRAVQPSLIHAITIKPVLYSGLISRLFSKIRFVASISGMGFVFTDDGIKAKLIRVIVSILYKRALGGDNTYLIFQNKDDQRAVQKLACLAEDRQYLIRGSGVDLSRYMCGDSQNGQLIVMFLARLLIDKGVREFVDAAKSLSALNARFVIVGDVDLGNPNSIDAEQLSKWQEEGDIEFWGYTSNPEKVIAQSDIMVLPSYREGLPKSLIEAAACGKAVITTDVPGCRDAIEPDVTGLLVPPKDPNKLAEAIQYLLENPDVRAWMGKEGRRMAEAAFDVQGVVQRHMEIYGLES